MLNKKMVFMASLAIGSVVGAGLWYQYTHPAKSSFMERIGLKHHDTLTDRAAKDFSKASHMAQERFVDFQKKGLKHVDKGRERVAEMFDHAKANIAETMEREFEALADRLPS